LNASTGAASFRDASAGLGGLAAAWLVAVASVLTVAVQTFGQYTPPIAQPAQALTPIAPPVVPVTIRNVVDGPGADEVTVLMSAPFSGDRVDHIANTMGMEVVAAYPAFARFVLKSPAVETKMNGSDSATVYFPKLMTWTSVLQYLADNELQLAARRHDQEFGGWVVDVTLPKIEVQPVDAYAGSWRAHIPGHATADRVAAWASANAFEVVSYDSATGEVELHGHAVPRPVPVPVVVPNTISQLRSLLQNLMAQQASAATPAVTPPVTPPALAVPSGLEIAAGTAQLKWQATAGASAYAVWRATATTGPWTLVGRVPMLTGVQPTYTDSTAASGTSYYRVTSLKPCAGSTGTDCDNQSPLVFDELYATAVVATTIPAATTTTGAGTTTTSNGTTTGTTTGTGTSTGNTTNTTTTNTTTTGTNSAGGSTTNTSTNTGTGTTTATPPATSPTSASATAADGHVVVSWPAVPGATGYRVYRAAPGQTAALVARTTATQLTDVGGTPTVTYTYQVLADVPAPTAAPPASTTVTWTPATSVPVILSVQPTSTTLSGTVVLTATVRTGDGAGTVTWTISGGPQGSATIGSGPAAPSSADPLTWSSQVSWNSANVADGSYQLHTAVADGSGHSSAFDTAVRVVNAPPPAPTALGAKPLASGVALTWQQPAAPEAALYVVSRADGNAAPAQVMELPAGTLSWVDPDASAGTHTYSVLLQDRFGHQSQATTSASVTSAGAGAPTVAPLISVRLADGLPVTADGPAADRLLLIADAVSGSGITFQYAADGDASWTPVPATTVCSPGCAADWSLSGVAPGHHRVRGVSASGQPGPAVGFTVVTTTPPAAPNAPAAAVAPAGVLLHWTDLPDQLARSFVVSRLLGGTWQDLARVDGTDYMDGTAPAGTALQYRVRALGAGGEGAESPATSVSLPDVQRPLSIDPLPHLTRPPARTLSPASTRSPWPGHRFSMPTPTRSSERCWPAGPSRQWPG